MKRQVAAFALLSSLANTAAAFAELGDAKYVDQGPGTYCITYLSTYLVPVSVGTELPEPSQNITEPEEVASSRSDEVGSFSSDITSGLLTTLNPQQPSSAPASEPTSVDFDPTGQRVIFAISPSENRRKRDLGGFVGNGNPDVCTFATVFTLGNGRLFEGGIPISYLGNGFQVLQSSSVPSVDDITTAFSSDGSFLRFSNPELPGGQASFCQTSSDGQVYMTFTSQPQGCIPVRLTIYGAERCINGRIDGLETSTAATNQDESTQVSERPITENSHSTSFLSPDPTDEEPHFPTMTIDPTRPLSFSNFTSRQSTAELSFTSGIVLPSLDPSRSDEPVPVETETLVSSFITTSEGLHTSLEAETSVLDRTSAPPVFESSSSINELPPLSLSTSIGDETFSSSILPFSSEPSSVTDTSEFSTVLTTAFESTSDEPTTTIATETTTTTQEPIIITNRVANGRFSMSDPDSGEGIMGFETEGDAVHRQGDCFSGDGSQDDGCVVLQTSNDRKRAIGSSAGISQMLTSLSPSRTTLYTIQFYYVVITVGGSQACRIDAYLGNQQAYSQGLFTSGGVSISWNRVLTTVRADSQRASFGISMFCSGNGFAIIYVDSVFLSNQVTPDNIDDHQLEFGDAEIPPQQSTSRNPPILVESTTSSAWAPSSTAVPSDSTSSWLFEPETSDSNESTQTPSASTIEDSTTIPQNDESTQTPSASSSEDPTTSSQTTTASETPTEICKYTHGEECEFDRFNYPHDALCAYGAFFTGETWRESRTDYPHQNNPYQCIAICKSMENCQSVGYFSNENRCLFTSTRIRESDFTNFGSSQSWKHSYWVDKRCWTCPDCIDESVPNTPPGKCSYTQGDACTRNTAPEGVVCNTNAYMAGGYWTGDQWIDQYPHQDSSEACAAICHGIRDCKGSAFKDGKCKFSAFLLSTTGGPIPLELNRDESMNSIWDDPSCFTCPGCTD